MAFQLGLSDVIDKQDLLEEAMKQVRGDVKTLVSENDKIKEMLLALVEKNDLSITEEDIL